MRNINITVRVEHSPFIISFPALDGLVAWLTGQQQKEIDGLTAQVKQLTQSLQDHQQSLQTAINKETT
jgi:uncharacterized coiled-coil protein SlyX